MASVTGTANNDTIAVGSASEGVNPQTGATDSDDLISGLAGADTLDGGAGSDTFVLGPGDGADAIENFVQGEDKIDLDGQDVSFEQLIIEDVDENGVAGKKITVNEDSITLSGFSGELAADDFVGLNESIAGAQVTGTDGDDVIIAGFASEGVLNAPDDTSGTTNDADNVAGEAGNDTIVAGGGDDTVDGGAGNDAVLGDGGNDDVAGFEGDDALTGGDGEDSLAGGAGDDELTGGAGIDRFTFDPSDAAEGNDTVTDFAVGEDLISIAAADILNSSPDLSELSPAALDRSEDWSIAATEGGEDTANGGDGEDTVDGGDGEDTVDGGDGDETGGIVITHPGGTITVEGVAFGDGTDSFEDLAAAGALEVADLVVGTEEGENLEGTDNDDVIDGLAGNDTLIGGSGDDILSGGAGGDDFAFDPSNAEEGDDTVLDLTFQVVTDTSQRDYISLSSEQVLAADPDLPAANNGDPDNPDDDETLLTLDDFDASENWSLGASEDGWLSITHPGGSIELAGILANADASFNDLAPVLKVDGEAWSGPIDLADGGGGEDTVDGGGEDTVDGGDGEDTVDGGDGEDTVDGGGEDTVDGGAVRTPWTAATARTPWTAATARTPWTAAAVRTPWTAATARTPWTAATARTPWTAATARTPWTAATAKTPWTAAAARTPWTAATGEDTVDGGRRGHRGRRRRRGHRGRRHRRGHC